MKHSSETNVYFVLEVIMSEHRDFRVGHDRIYLWVELSQVGSKCAVDMQIT